MVDTVPAAARADALFAEAKSVMVAGVSAAARVNGALGRPLLLERGDGSRVYDIDGHELIDMNASQGATLLGHNHPAVRAAVERALDLGVICSFETEHHTRLRR